MRANSYRYAPSNAVAQSGFTLIEVMVAVVVIAIALPAMMVAMMGQVDGIGFLRDKTQAQWVADNQLADIRIQNRLTGQVLQGEQSGTEELGGRKWQWKARSQAFSQENFHDVYGVEVSVWLEGEGSPDGSESKDAPIIRVTGIMQQFSRTAMGRTAPVGFTNNGSVTPPSSPVQRRTASTSVSRPDGRTLPSPV